MLDASTRVAEVADRRDVRKVMSTIDATCNPTQSADYAMHVYARADRSGCYTRRLVYSTSAASVYSCSASQIHVRLARTALPRKTEHVEHAVDARLQPICMVEDALQVQIDQAVFLRLLLLARALRLCIAAQCDRST